MRHFHSSRRNFIYYLNLSLRKVLDLQTPLGRTYDTWGS